MINAGSDDRKSQGDIDTFDCFPGLLFTVINEADGLERNMSLIMIHADHDVVPSAERFREYRVRRKRSDGVDVFCFGGLNGGGDFLNFLSAE